MPQGKAPDVDVLAGQLYCALSEVAGNHNRFAFLPVLGDLNDGKSYAAAKSQTRIIFQELAANLTRIQARG